MFFFSKILYCYFINGLFKLNAIQMVNDCQAQGSSTSSGAAAIEGPPCLIVLGMAGAGKTSFVQRLTSHLHANGTYPYLINLDPAAGRVPFPANIDIRDTVKYKAVMQEYGLGPNGAILTCLNLLCTKFDQVLSLLEKRRSTVPYVILDTPGQIEVFTWSASGAIITGSLANNYPTLPSSRFFLADILFFFRELRSTTLQMIAYVMDSARSTNPITFMSNMLYACSILYRTKLPFFLVLNKADVVDPDFAVSWLTDFEKFQEALDQSNSSFANDLTRSLSLVLDSFYQKLNWVAISSRTGEGFDKVLEIIEKCKLEYASVYKPFCEQVERDKAQMDAQAQYTAERLASLEIKETNGVSNHENPKS